MKITIEAAPKEVAALISELQERQGNHSDVILMADWIDKTIKDNPGLFAKKSV